MLKRKSPSILTLVNSFKLTIIKTMYRISKGIDERITLAKRILTGLGQSSARKEEIEKKEILVSKKIERLEDEGLIKISQGIIHPADQSEQNPQKLERSVFQSLREIDEIELEEKTDVYLVRLRKSDGIFSWQKTFLSKLKVYFENIFFFWKSSLAQRYTTASQLAQRFLEWETKINIKSGPPDIKEMLSEYFNDVNTIDSSTILERTSFGEANSEPLGHQPVFIISDLHLGSGSKFDRFNKAAKLVRLLKVIEKLNATLIINGDFFDFWQATPKNVFIKYREILWELIRIKRVILIVGNHDSWLENFNHQRFLMPNISVMPSYHDPGNNIYIEHGHRGDPINSSALGEILARIVMTTEKIIRLHFAEKLENFVRMIIPEKFWYQQQVSAYVGRMAEIYYDELKLEPKEGKLMPLRIIFGHIHYINYLETIKKIQLECLEILPEVEFISSGHWTDPNPVFLFMVAGKIHTLQLSGGTDDFISILKEK
ncbi:metallophosphoesterase [candidate division CSSED10-310 bacterium]|uniref:Metallophosphoesterase n=1 Tax=candidate division CSSED10-310 bacterium TaxID=2855610 RepID=A0ABV6Z4D6_UNCC1